MPDEVESVGTAGARTSMSSRASRLYTLAARDDTEVKDNLSQRTVIYLPSSTRIVRCKSAYIGTVQEKLCTGTRHTLFRWAYRAID